MARLNVRDKLVDEDKLDLSCCELTDVPVKDIVSIMKIKLFNEKFMANL